MKLLQPCVDLLDKMADASDQLIGGAQAKFMLMFDTLPEVKQRLQWKMKGHF